MQSRRTKVVFCVLLLVLFWFSAPAAHAQGILWYDDYARARATAAASGRPLLVTVVRPNCEICNRLMNGTYGDPTVTAAIHQYFVPVRLDAVKHPNYIQALNIHRFPITILASSTGDIHHAVEGNPDAQAMLAAFQEAFHKMTRQPRVMTHLTSRPAMQPMPEPTPVTASRPGLMIPSYPITPYYPTVMPTTDGNQNYSRSPILPKRSC